MLRPFFLKLAVLLSLVICLLSLLAAPSAVAVVAEPDFELAEALALYGPRSTTLSGTTLIVSLLENQVSSELYLATILQGICPISAHNATLQGVEEIQILNKFSYQGFVFDGGSAACQELLQEPKDVVDWRLLAKTHAAP